MSKGKDEIEVGDRRNDEVVDSDLTLELENYVTDGESKRSGDRSGEVMD